MGAPNKSPTLRKRVSLIPDIIYPRDLDSSDPPISLDDPFYKSKILAEGDSWFSIGAIPSSNLLYELRFPQWTVILSLAYPGDTIVHMSELASNQQLMRVLAKKRFNYKWDTILLSGGGNDLIGAADDIILDKPVKSADPEQPESYIDKKILSSTIQAVEDGYRRIIELRDSRDSLSKNAPVITHTYDYPTPRNAPANFLVTPVAGPWLYRIFKKNNYVPAMQQKIVDYMIDSLADRLLSLATGKKALPNFFVVDTRNSLIRAKFGETGNSNDWLNEIHPNGNGYKKIASKLSSKFI